MSQDNNNDNDNNNSVDYREYYLLNATWDNDWIDLRFCTNCGFMPGPDVTFNIYQVKDCEYCCPCYDTIRKRQVEKGMKWEEQYYGKEIIQI